YFSQSDMDMIFHRDSAPLELAMLSPYEMQTTEGEWIPWLVTAAIGGIYGGIQNIGYQIGRNQGWSWKTFGTGVAVGAGRALYFARNPIGAIQMGLGTPLWTTMQVGTGKLIRRVGW
ncbi:MAG: hypothetical protein K2O85_07870, partial [Helicobacter sp.]|nr:hypothetical protein [Helicobacter sp.]